MKRKVKILLLLVLVVGIAFYPVVFASADWTDGTGALTPPDMYVIPGGGGGEEPASAGGPLTSVIGTWLILSGVTGVTVGSLFADDVVTGTAVVADKLTDDDRTGIFDRIKNGAIAFKNGAIEYTGEAWNWLSNKFFTKVVTESNPIIDPVTGVASGSVLLGTSDVFNFWNYTGTVWGNQWLNEIPSQITFGKSTGAQVVMYNGVMATYSVIYNGGNVVDYSVIFELPYGDIFEFFGSVNGVSNATGFAFRQLTKSPSNNVWIPFLAGTVSYTNVASDDYSVRKCRYNNQQLEYDVVAKRIWTNHTGTKTFLTEPGQFTSYLDFLNKTLWNHTSLSEIPYTYNPDNWIVDHPLTDDSKLVVPVPGQTVTTDPVNNPYNLPDGNAQTAGNIIPDIDPEQITITNPITDPLTDPDVSDVPFDDENLNKFKMPLQLVFKKFPFSIPFDVYRLISVLNVPAKEPVFDIPLAVAGTVNYIHLAIPEKLKSAFVYIRWFELGLFAIGLAVGTKKLIWK